MNDTTTGTPAERRRAMLAAVQDAGYAQRPEVARVIATVPRHLFVPDADLTEAHDPWQAVITHRFADGTALSCASAPFVVAMMLDQLAVEPGSRILEIGAGTGYNATLLAELTGTDADVTTIDIDPDVTANATATLAATGHPDVRVHTGDGALGVPDHSPYDRIIATVSPWDITPAWWQQLAPGGRMVLPLRWRGQTRTVAFTRHPDGHLVADSICLCGFVSLVGDDGERSAAITDHDDPVRLHWDIDQPIDPAALHGVLDGPRTTVWSGASVAGDEPFDSIWLRLTATDQRVCRINAPVDTPPEVCDPIVALRAPALVEGTSLAYLTSRRSRHDDSTRWELGIISHGPAAADLAEHFRAAIRAWAVHRGSRQPTLTAHPAPAALGDAPGTVITKTHSTLVLAYPDA